MNILDHFDENPSPWYDRLVQAIQNISLSYRILGIFISTYGSVGIMAYKSDKGLDLESLLFIPIGLLFMLSVVAGIVLYFFVFLGYVVEKINSKPNKISKLDYANCLLITTVGCLLTLAVLALLGV